MAKRQHDPLEAPYKPSRAALRDYYGARSIDGRAPQSSRDYTPSGRIRYLEQNPNAEADEKDAAARGRQLDRNAEQDFRNKFRPRAPGFDPVADRANSPWRGVSPAMTVELPYLPPAAPSPVAMNQPPSMGLPTTPLAFNLSEPSTLPASTLAQFAPPGIPSVTAPQAYVPPWRRRQNTGYMGSILSPTSRWLT